MMILGAPGEVLPQGAKSDFPFILESLASLTMEDPEFLRGSYLEVHRMRRNYLLDFAREEGVARGIEKGSLAEVRKNVLRVLRRRFGEASEDLRQAVEGIADLARLEMLLEEAAVAPTVDAFRSVLVPKP